jgi:hypothetical protein
VNTPPRKESETGLYAPVWRKINQMLDYMREISVVNGRDVRVSRTMNGTLLLGTAKGEASVPSVSKLCRVKSIEADYLVCRDWGGTDNTSDDGASDIYVARSYELRRTTYHGKSVEFDTGSEVFTASYSYTSNTRRVKTILLVPETQVIVPYYKVDFTVIDAVELVGESGVLGPDGQSITLSEQTQRAWARI